MRCEKCRLRIDPHEGKKSDKSSRKRYDTLRFIGLADAHIAADHIENVESTLNLNAAVISFVDVQRSTTNESM